VTALFWASDESERRILTTVGAALVASTVFVVAILYFVRPFDKTPSDYISLNIEMPYAGEGVASGTPVIMHGVKVGYVSGLVNRSGGGVRIDTLLQAGPVKGLSDAMGLDFRPSNYFGVTGINLIPRDGGQPLRNGSSLVITPEGNFTLQALLYRLGLLTHDVINQRLINVIERGTRYAKGLTPFLETMLVVGKAVADVQTVSTERLLRNTAGVSVGAPGWIDGLSTTVDQSLHTGLDNINLAMNDPLFNHYVTTYDDQLKAHYDSELKLAQTDIDTFTFGPVKEFFDAASTDLFVKVGNVLSTHTYDLFPVVEEIRSVTSVVPKVIDADGIGNTLRELHSRLVRMYEGSGDQRAMQVKIVLDEIPAVAAPLGLSVGSHATGGEGLIADPAPVDSPPAPGPDGAGPPAVESQAVEGQVTTGGQG
jgi:hypothetical protein